MFLLFLLSAVACAFAIPQTDVSETTYNEVDRPVNQAPPVVPGIKYLRPSSTPVILAGELCLAGRDMTPQPFDTVSAPVRACHHTHSLQDLFCVFLI